MSQVTKMLEAVEQGDKQAANQLLPLVYDELRKLACQKLAQEKPGQTLQPTALVHEAYLRLVQPNPVKTFDNRRCFFLAAAEAMRRILIDRARYKNRLKRGGSAERQELIEDALTTRHDHESLLACHDALDQLEQIDSQAAAVVKLHIFLEFNLDEIADTLNISARTVYRDWHYARSWLFRQYRDDSDKNPT